MNKFILVVLIMLFALGYGLADSLGYYKCKDISKISIVVEDIRQDTKDNPQPSMRARIYKANATVIGESKYDIIGHKDVISTKEKVEAMIICDSSVEELQSVKDAIGSGDLEVIGYEERKKNGIISKKSVRDEYKAFQDKYIVFSSSKVVAGMDRGVVGIGLMGILGVIAAGAFYFLKKRSVV